MVSINKVSTTTVATHEGAPAKVITPSQELRRSVLSCMLFEDEFYEDGMQIAERIVDLCMRVDPAEVSALALEARGKFKLRHAPLLLARALAKRGGGKLVGDTIRDVCQRADEPAEFLALYWATEPNNSAPLSAQVKRGIAEAITKFDPYSLAKYNRAGHVTLKTVLVMTHPKPKSPAQEKTFKQILNDTLPPPDTWEVAKSAGADTAEVFTRLLTEGKLGYLALLRNLRLMRDAGVDEALIFDSLRAGAGRNRVLPFRFIAAARAVPQWWYVLDECMQASMAIMDRMPGKTVILVDRSMSMSQKLSSKSQLNRLDAASALAALVTGVADRFEVYSFSSTGDVTSESGFRGMAVIDQIARRPRQMTDLGGAVRQMGALDYDRLIVITDEQSHTRVPDPKGRAYMVNVASNRNGVGYGKWVHVDGFSEAIIDWIKEYEAV